MSFSEYYFEKYVFYVLFPSQFAYEKCGFWDTSDEYFKTWGTLILTSFTYENLYTKDLKLLVITLPRAPDSPCT